MPIVPNKPVSSPVLIGRQVGVGGLLTLIEQAGRGQGQVVLLSGLAQLKVS